MIEKSTAEDEPQDVAIAQAVESMLLSIVSNATLSQIRAVEDNIIDRGLNEKDTINSQGMVDKLIPGMYARVLNIPKGTFLIGKIHKRPYIDICASGDITLKSFLHDGSLEETERINGFKFMEGKAGRKRVGFAHEDTVWITVDPTSATCIEEAERDITTLQMDEYLNIVEVAAWVG